MSILIKGMKMPTEGKKTIAIYKLEGEFYASLNGTELSPLIELPDHGDLIDREELLKKRMKMDAFAALEWVSDVDICMARTVIPAERSEDGDLH